MAREQGSPPASVSHSWSAVTCILQEFSSGEWRTVGSRGQTLLSSNLRRVTSQLCDPRQWCHLSEPAFSLQWI